MSDQKPFLTYKESLPPHLGGHDNITHTDEGALLYLRDECGIKSVMDIGCGPGGQVKLARSLGITAEGVDGDWSLKTSGALADMVVHDYTNGPYIPFHSWAVAWSVEFLEHLEERFLANVFFTFRKCGLIVITHALPGTERAYHHVNCRTPEYWDWQFGTRGFAWDAKRTNSLREASTMTRNFMRETGRIYRNHFHMR